MTIRSVQIVLFALLIGSAGADSSIVDNPDKCEAQWQIRLEPHRITLGDEDSWPEQLILDANKGGDFKMAQRYMAKYGWFSAATGDANDLTLYFMPETKPVKSAHPLFSSRPVANVAEGIKRACYAAWISNVPFIRVTKRGSGGKSVLYSVTTENMPVRDF